MTPSLPFQGQSDMREELLADVRANGALTRLWLRQPSIDQRFPVIAQAYGLDETFLRLLTALAARSTLEVHQAFIVAAFEKLRLDEPMAGLASRWMLSCWQELIAERLSGSRAYGAASAVAALIERDLVEPVAADGWRAALRTISLLPELPAAEQLYADVMQAMACDVRTMPGAVSDVVESLRTATYQGSLLVDGWDEACNSEYSGLAIRFSKEIGEEVAAMNLTDNSRVAEIYRSRSEEKFTLAGKLDLLRHATQAGDNANEAVRIHAEHERARFLEFL